MGPRVGLKHGSRAWVISTGADGAQLRLEDGRAHLRWYTGRTRTGRS